MKDQEQAKISGHHLGMVASYFYNSFGDSKKEHEFLKGYFTKNVDKANNLHYQLKEEKRILIISGPDDLCELCDSKHKWCCAYPQDKPALVNDEERVKRVGLKINQDYSLDEILEAFKFLRKGK